MVKAMNSLDKMNPSTRELKERQRRWLLEQLKLKGHGSRSSLAKHLGIRNDAVTRMTNHELGKEARDITFEELLGMAKFFGEAPPGLQDAPAFQNGSKDTRTDLTLPADENLVVGHKVATRVANGEQKVPEFIPGTALIGEVRDFPVFGSAQGGKGAMVLTTEPVDWTVRPSSLLKVRDGYGIIIVGESMSPKFENGDTVMVNPHRPPRSGDSCIFRRHDDDGSVLICIKELVREAHDLWYVRQYNPKKTFTLKKSEWQVCHSVVGALFR